MLHLCFIPKIPKKIKKKKSASSQGTFDPFGCLLPTSQGQDELDPMLTRFNYPSGLALQKVDAGVKLYVADAANHQALGGHWLVG